MNKNTTLIVSLAVIVAAVFVLNKLYDNAFAKKADGGPGQVTDTE